MAIYSIVSKIPRVFYRYDHTPYSPVVFFFTPSLFFSSSFLSGQRDSNARHSPWQGDALPLSYARRFATFLILSHLLGFVKRCWHINKIIRASTL